MRTYLLVFTSILILSFSAPAQMTGNVLNGEFGVAVGAAHYFGDLNPNIRLNRPKPAVSVLFRKQFGEYIALRLQGTFARLGYSDAYAKNEVQRTRNLSFNSDIFELGLMGDFNFFRFRPGEYDYRFTPYTSIGVGIFSYDPFAYLGDEKYFLRPLNTEGQASAVYPDRKSYSSMAMSFPVGVGIKYNINYRLNLTFEISHRFTSTDYLDDVSRTYAGQSAFPPAPGGDASVAYLLQDRSYEVVGTPIGIQGRQRGNSERKDTYVTAMLGLSFNLTSYKCPDVR